VEINHLVTAMILSAASTSGSSLRIKFGSINKSGCSPQNCEYSTNEVGDNMKGGAVNDDRSPLYEAIDLRKLVHEEDFAASEDIFPVLLVWMEVEAVVLLFVT
jgi:hypothetical protein